MATKKYTPEEARERKNARQREYAKRTGRAADRKYQKEKTKQYALRMFLSTDADIIDWLENKENKTGYIKQLIREDIQRNQ